MAFQIILTYTKDDPLVDWYVLPQGVRDLVEEYKADGRIIEWIEEEIDALTLQYRVTWDNQPRSLDFDNESANQACQAEKNSYNTANNITYAKTYGQ